MITEELIEKEIALFKAKIKDYQSRGLKIFASSSFQSHSLPMLHILASIDNSLPVYFLNTGYHFAETLEYRDRIKKEFDLNIINLESPISRIRQKNSQGNLMYTTDPDQCCYFNKTLPMETVLLKHDVWISGVRKDQNANRSQFEYEEKGVNDTLRFHPMLNWSKQMIWHYIRTHNLPQHPLENGAYISIGCEPCTRKMSFADSDERDGRWQGLKKNECGLHTELIEK